MRSKRRKISIFLTLLLAFALIPPLLPTAAAADHADNVFFVAETDDGIWQNGIWQEGKTVYINLQKAIDAAYSWSQTNDQKPAYVLVAVGTYTHNNPFSLKKNVVVIGGFAGTEPGITPVYAQIGAQKTILDGEHTRRVFYNTGEDSSGTLKNVVIANGYVAGQGAGMYNLNNSPTLINCTFIANEAQIGGGMVNVDSSPALTYCTFTNNTAINGAGIYNANSGSRPVLTNCTFVANAASNMGGGMYNNLSTSPVLTNCTFEANIASGGGGMHNVNSSHPVLVNCIFKGNIVFTNGGGMHNAGYSSPRLVHCTFIENESKGDMYGGGMYNASSPVLTNCTMIKNTAKSGGGIYNHGSAVKPVLINSIVTLNTGNKDVYNNLSRPVYNTTIVGDMQYDAAGIGVTLETPSDSDDFDMEGALKSTAIYAIKEGNYSLYADALEADAAAGESVLNRLNHAYGMSLAAPDMRDGKGDLVVNSKDSTIDMGAFRYIGSETEDEFVSPAMPPVPIITAMCGGKPYISGELVNESVAFTMSMGSLMDIVGQPFLPQSYLEDLYQNTTLHYKVGDSTEQDYTAPVISQENATYIFYEKYNGDQSEAVTYITNHVPLTMPPPVIEPDDGNGGDGNGGDGSDESNGNSENGNGNNGGGNSNHNNGGGHGSNSSGDIGSGDTVKWLNPFVDVTEVDWFYGDVEYVYVNGLFAGTSENTFGPRISMTRGMLVTVLGKLTGVDPNQYTQNSFDDVSQDQYYAAFVGWAKENGVAAGIGRGLFAPDMAITREQMAVILWQYTRLTGIDVLAGENTNMLSYHDASKVSDYAISAVLWACDEGIITGKPGAQLDPQGGATRAEVAAMLHRFLEK